VKPSAQFELPEGLDWGYWVERWDRMQERYLVRRDERMELIVRLVRDTQPFVRHVLDLGCGTGSLMLAVLKAFPEAQVLGLDFDPTLLALARARLADYAGRAQLMEVDLREESWVETLRLPVDAAVSATALHWLPLGELALLYKRLAKVLHQGGIFLNADHVGSDCTAVQEGWERHRELMRAQEGHSSADDWDGFWEAYLSVLGPSARQFRQSLIGEWQGADTGIPLAWHLDQLRASGFTAVDCFWRCDCDAIYGGIRA